MKHFFLRILCGRKREKRKNSKLEETKREIDDGRCACCLAPFLVSRGVRCNDCGAKSCKKACSRWDTSDNAWHCIFCYQQRLWVRRNEKWFDIFGNAANEEEEVHSVFGTAKSRVYVAGHAVAVPNMEQIQEDREEKYMVHAVQNFVEKIVEGLIDSVDDTPIDRLYNDAKYDKFLEEHRPPLIAALTRLIACLEASLINKPSTDPPAMAHGALREIVERAVEEARKLPGLSADTENPREGRAIADNSYEDLLATAILNKVIEKYQRERVDGNSNVLRDTDSPKAKCTRIETENGLEEEDVASYACYRPESNGDRSESIGRNGDDQEPVSFMMEERIEEITTITDDGELQNNDALEFKHTRRVPFPEYGMDIVDPRRELSSPTLSTSSDSSDLNRDEFSPVRTKRHAADHATDLVSPIESWEDNWLFQKKKTSRSQPDAVAMLVPSSNADYKALIGDRDAEDTSDLSECSSTKSDEEIEKELIEAINNVVPRTPRTSECDAKSNQMLNSQKMLSDTECRRNEVDACQKETKVEETVVICKRFNKDEKNAKVNENLLEEKTIKDEDDKETQNESSSTLITVAEKNIEAIKSNEEKPKNTIESDEKTIVNIAVESFAQTSMKMQSEKPNERNDREGNIAEEEQQESEYTEHYDTAIQRHLDSLTKVEVCSAESEMADETRKITDEQLRKSENNSTEKQKSERSEAEVQLSYATIEEDYVDATTNNDRLSAPPRPGTIAEREHKKWENALPIENNPYSEESIRKRCLERQYSRTSDISGAHYELTKLNEVNLETLLVPNRPDIKRFGRDYYINQSKAANGEQHERARSAMSSVSSRPSSSLSQQSNSDEQREQQVSQQHELERFEGASLRGSLSRRRCRDPRASPHFAINPLLHLELARSSANDRSDCDGGEEHAGNLVGNARTADNAIENATGNRDSRNCAKSNLRAICEKQEGNRVLAESLETNTDFRQLVSADWSRLWRSDRDGDPPVDEEPIMPQYDDSREELPCDCDGRDHDSGMCSIGSRDSETSDRWRKLYQMEDNDCHDEQISSIGGRRFWTTGKYHTYGGIRIRSKKTEDLDDFEDELISPENCFADHATEFAKLKFQTFGGIKRSRKINKKKIPSYRRIRLRPVLSEAIISNTEKNCDRVETETSANFELYSNVDYAGSFDRLASLNSSASFEGFTSFEHSTSSTFEESDWQDEEDDVTNDRVSARYTQIARGRNRTSPKIKHRNLIRRSNRNSSCLWSLPTEDDEWQDEIDCASGEIIMNKFLKDVSKRRKAFSDDDVTTQERENRSRKHRETFEKNSNGGLEKSKNNENNLESSKESQMQEQWKSDNNRPKKLNVRSLSDVTIW
ncbi:uncharacterized protein [Linepithema humile]|uniref:uncharacterized protein isoform X2 n=1 Tax=Linepithema humile TaxID=83485 RepID=UPI00351EDADA